MNSLFPSTYFGMPPRDAAHCLCLALHERGMKQTDYMGLSEKAKREWLSENRDLILAQRGKLDELIWQREQK